VNYLELVQATASDAGTEGSVPATVVGQTGRAAKVVYWVNEAWRNIQNASNHWRWMQSEFTGTTIDATQRYDGTAFLDDFTGAAIGTRFGRFIPRGPNGDLNGLSIYQTSIGRSDEGTLRFIDDWALFYGKILRGYHANDKPLYSSIDDAGRLVLAPTPSSTGWTIRGRYRKSVQTLSGNTDTPEMPEDYHDIIKLVALHLLGTFDEAQPVQLQLWQLRRFQNWSMLESTQLPQVGLGGPIA